MVAKVRCVRAAAAASTKSAEANDHHDSDSHLSELRHSPHLACYAPACRLFHAAYPRDRGDIGVTDIAANAMPDLLNTLFNAHYIFFQLRCVATGQICLTRSKKLAVSAPLFSIDVVEQRCVSVCMCVRC